MNQDAEYLKLLAIFHYVVAGMTAVFALFPVIHLIFGLVMVFAPQIFAGSRTPPPTFIGWFFIAFSLGFILAGLTLAVLIFSAGRCLSRRKAYLFCLALAAVECAIMPFGTVLDVLTIMTLNLSAVKALFGRVAP